VGGIVVDRCLRRTQRRRHEALREAAWRLVVMTKDEFDPRSVQAWAREELAKLAKPE